MLEFEYEVKDKAGLHARPAGMIVKEASRFDSEIILKNTETANSCDAKKLFALMNLGIKCGTKILITCDGSDENNAVEAMKQVVQQNL